MKRRYQFKLFSLLVTIAPFTFSPSVVQAQNAQQVAQKALPSVVLIAAKPAKGKSISLGSGFFVQPHVIATAYHVTEITQRLKSAARTGVASGWADEITRASTRKRSAPE